MAKQSAIIKLQLTHEQLKRLEAGRMTAGEIIQLKADEATRRRCRSRRRGECPDDTGHGC